MPYKVKYNFGVGLWKTLIRLGLWGIPVVILSLQSHYPEVLGLTVGGILNLIYNWLKNKR